MNDVNLLRAIFTSATEHALIAMDARGTVTAWNPGAERIFGFHESEIVGNSASQIFSGEDRPEERAQEEFARARDKGRATDYRWFRRKDGTDFWGESVVTPVRSGAGGYLKIVRDITETKHEALALQRQATVDALTGLANRASFELRLSEITEAALRSEHLFVLHLVDLDRFRLINDQLGGRGGDSLLRQAAERMRKVMRDTDFIARLEEDEFAVLQANVRAPEAGAILADKLLAALAKPFVLEGREVRLAASIGMAVCPHDAPEPTQLLRKAELALRKAKKDGRGDFSYFNQHLDEQAHKRKRDENEIRRAVKERHFWLAYQPKTESETGKTVAVEALLRCSNLSLCSYSINEVLNLAVRSGLMPELNEWILAEACRQTRAWQVAGHTSLKVCVNFSASELMDTGAAGRIHSILQQSGLPPSDLVLELTEKQIVEREDKTVAVIEGLRKQGIAVALDDFGTGFSSLGYLRWLPVDALKLDRTFLRDIPQDAKSCAIAKAIIDLGHIMGFTTIAEGVETEEQAAFCREQGCDLMQGFLLCRPQPADEMTRWLFQ